MTQLLLFKTQPKDKGDMLVQDYEEYGAENRHLSDKEALAKFLEARSINPEAYVVINDLDCGHWTIDAYNTESQKQKFLKRKWLQLVYDFDAFFEK